MSNTLLSHHKNKINDINNYDKENVKIEKRIKQIDKELNTLSKKDISKLNTEQVRLKFKLIEEKEKCSKKIKNINDELYNYHLDAFECLVEYHNDKKQKIEENDSFCKTGDNKKDIFLKYLEAVDDTYINTNTINNDDFSICKNCNINMKLNSDISCYICEECGLINNIILIEEKKKYSNSNNEPTNFSYKRINHFIEWLNNLQGKTKINIPKDVIDIVKNDIKRLKLSRTAVTKKIIKDILEKHDLSEYSEQIKFIMIKVFDSKFPQFSKELEEKLIHMFKQVQEPFAKHCPKNRSNFLSNSYCMTKFLELLEQDQYIKYITKMKSREKIYYQEQIWKKICEELKWEFIESI